MARLSALLLASAIASVAWGADDHPRLNPLPPTDRNAQTGPAVGARIPAFEAVDQHGKARTFDSLKGPHGLVLLFVRSADW
jgi:cytochrome oxidase Cu insertion factor (SCO1/SenC/PrrC family)